ncbi:phosphorothioated DNA-binding restriction endonuclease [Actinomadura sp. DC4]|uniref:phosphorothioated DNA-binding restriction endonuclease n=1 Tax=Actinomadura sp. DC4 TaxID=3055069 RepID=UPI0025B0CB94|nr:HNH endonuclease [Actinomadura sp. DC4]MDN3354912.1 HNH endonuclease [Actinomadura sp. DC4]
MEWVERVTHVRQWSRGGERASHKPLLLLYALGHFQRNGDSSILYSEAEEHLAGLLREFGPPRTTSPAYPFHHLTSDGLWEVRTAAGGESPGPRVGALRSQAARGRLTTELVAALRHDPHLLSQLGRAILDVNFEPSLHEDICTAAGLDLEAVELAGARFPRRRDPAFRAQVMVAYEYQCAFCGYDGWLNGSAVGLDAAHVRWWAFEGPDEVTNGICLCALHHKLFDKGVLGMTGDRRVNVSAHYVGRGPAARDQVHTLAGRRVFSPQAAFPGLDDAHIAWHAREVFRAPARAA